MFDLFKEVLWFYFMNFMVRNPRAFANVDVYYFSQFLMAIENSQDLTSFNKVINQYMVAGSLTGFDLSEMSARDVVVFAAVISTLRVTHDGSKEQEAKISEANVIYNQASSCLTSAEKDIFGRMNQVLLGVEASPPGGVSVGAENLPGAPGGPRALLNEEPVSYPKCDLYIKFIEYLESLLNCMRKSRNLLAYEFCPIFSPFKDAKYRCKLNDTQEKILKMIKFIQLVKESGNFQNLYASSKTSLANALVKDGVLFGCDWVSPAVTYALSFVMNPGDDKGLLYLSSQQENQRIAEIFDHCRDAKIDYGMVGPKHKSSIFSIIQCQEKFIAECYRRFGYDPNEIPDRYAGSPGESMFLPEPAPEICFGRGGMFYSASEPCIEEKKAEKPVSYLRHTSV